MAANQIQIEVRTLTSESTTASVSVNATVDGLKLLLRQSFVPAATSPNFHLFLKGQKLRLESEIGRLGIKPGEFLVLVPFVKKVSQKCDQAKAPLINSAEGSLSKFSDSAWSDMMQDLSYLRDDGAASVSSSGSFSVGDWSEVMGDRSGGREAKRKRGFGCDEVVLDMLRESRSRSVLDEQNTRRIVEFLELVKCLSDPYSGDCMLWRRKTSLQGCGLGMRNGNGNSCLCPEWLKNIMKAFAFLNMFSAIVQLQQERTTSTLLEKELEQLATFGVKLSMQDIEHLSVISPKAVTFVKNNGKESTSGNALVIIECSTAQNHMDKNNQEPACKQMEVSNIVNAVKMQESSFKSDLWEVVERLMASIGSNFGCLADNYPSAVCQKK